VLFGGGFFVFAVFMQDVWFACLEALMVTVLVVLHTADYAGIC